MNRQNDQHGTQITGLYVRRKSKILQNKMNQFFFTLKPQKTQTQILVPYKQLRNYFPYALIKYYENKLKIKGSKENQNQQQDIKYSKKDKLQLVKADNIEMEYNLQRIPRKKNKLNNQEQRDEMINNKKESIQECDSGLFDYDMSVSKQNFIQSVHTKQFSCAFKKYQNSNPYLEALDKVNLSQNIHSNKKKYGSNKKATTKF